MPIDQIHADQDHDHHHCSAGCVCFVGTTISSDTRGHKLLGAVAAEVLEKAARHPLSIFECQRRRAHDLVVDAIIIFLLKRSVSLSHTGITLRAA